ncbi:MAG: DEAD/DEAH box helicase, partial [Planctomycetota bacterium]
MHTLPIDEVLPQIVEAVDRAQPIVLKAPPGAGKTTGVPPAVMDSNRLPSGQVLLIQPRRLAARSAAARIASLMGCVVGERVGHHVRFDRKVGPRTELIVMTTGILLRRLQTDPLLDDVTCVILDEFHEHEGRATDELRLLPLLGLQRAGQQQLRHAHDAVHRRAE